MEILYFSSGILLVALAYVVRGVSKLNSRVDGTERGLEDAHNRVDLVTEELYRTLDSRLDKLEHRLKK